MKEWIAYNQETCLFFEQPLVINESYNEKTERHEGCAFSISVARSDGFVTKPVVCSGENAAEVYWNSILQLETKIREILSTPKPLVMTAEDWEKHKNVTECYICNQKLVRDVFLDSIPVWDQDTGQSHKKCS